MSQESIYNAPQSDLTTEDEGGFGQISFFSPSGRIGRVRMIAHNMLLVIIWYACLALLIAVIGFDQTFAGGVGGVA